MCHENLRVVRRDVSDDFDFAKNRKGGEVLEPVI